MWLAAVDDGSHGGTVSASVSLSFSPMHHTARITKLDVEMFHDESWKLIYFRVRKVKGQGHSRVTKNIAGMGLCTLVRAGF